QHLLEEVLRRLALVLGERGRPDEQAGAGQRYQGTEPHRAIVSDRICAGLRLQELVLTSPRLATRGLRYATDVPLPRAAHACDMSPALADFAHCVRAWGGLVARGRLTSPKDNLGARLKFADGSSSFVFRETAVAGATSDPTLLVIQFRLAALGSNH